jgi:hypothetical protein
MAESDTTPRMRMIDRLIRLRNDIRIHNPESENVVTMDWAINALRQFSAAAGQIQHLKECIDE